MEREDYLMESEEEALRLDLKTDRWAVVRQARWAGIGPGMRVADLGCGSGKTTSALQELVQPDGQAIGVDISDKRVAFATQQYGHTGARFVRADIREPIPELGQFDALWVRFVLEYYRQECADIVRTVSALLKPGGRLCLLDLDNNCLCHHEIPPRLERTMHGIMDALGRRANFDPYAGRRLYAHLCDLGYEEIRVTVEGHHLIYGELRENDAFNWMKKIEVAPQRIGYDFPEYPGGWEEFRAEFERFFADPRRFTYSPLIIAVGRKPRA
jgi:ubiquinone/menaquinone biosynthesis C-methylase UbiE